MAVVISIVPYRFLPARNGGQRGIALFNKYFGQHVQLTCITVVGNTNELAKNYQTISLLAASKSRYVNPLNFLRIRRIAKKIKATHVLIEHPYLGWLGALLKTFTGLKLIIHSHNIEGLRFKTLGKWWWNILWRYEKWVHSQADCNFFIHAEDLDYAVKRFKLDRKKCLVVTFGIERNHPPAEDEIQRAKAFVRTENNIDKNETILFFNGAFNYAPNVTALQIIDQTICPLLDNLKFNYKVVVCGPGLEEHRFTHPRLILKGFVDDIETYFMAADVFINPVMEGGGIKTKLVEALGFNCNAVSTVAGSVGIDPNLCNNKLAVIRNGDWNGFANQIIAARINDKSVSSTFYQHFYWGYSTERAANFIKSHAQPY